MNLRWISLIGAIVTVCALCSPVASAGELAAAPEFIVIDDFERYSDDIEGGNAIWQTWIDGLTNGTGSIIGYLDTGPHPNIAHGGRQSMPFDYDNVSPPYYSESSRRWSAPQDWTADGPTHLSLWLRAEPICLTVDSQSSVTLDIGSHEWGANPLRFGYRQLLGDGEVVARVEQCDHISMGVSRAGVMIREAGDWASIYAAVAVSADQGVVFEHLLKTGQSQLQQSQDGIHTPHWVKLSRRGNTFSAQHSADGQAWEDVTDAQGTAIAVDIPMPETVAVGVYMIGRPLGGPAFAEFSGITFAGEVSGPWQAADGVRGNSPDRLYLALKDHEGRTAVRTHPDPYVLNGTEWTEWRIPLRDVNAAGIHLKTVESLHIGIGDPNDPQTGGYGRVFIDDIRLIRRVRAADPYPADGDVNVPQWLVLRWSAGSTAGYHDVYFGDDANAVATATTTSDVYQGRQTLDEDTFDPGTLEWNKTYYWRVDEVNWADNDSPWRGNVWRFTTADFLVVDDFESYTNDFDIGAEEAIWWTWEDLWGCLMGDLLPWACFNPLVERTIVHGGRQAMAWDYINFLGPYYSELARWWRSEPPQDWTVNGLTTLVLYIRGSLANEPEPLYVAVSDDAHGSASAVHPDPQVLLATEWTEWKIPLSTFAGVDLARVETMYIGVADDDWDNPGPGGAGRIYIDDIRIVRSEPTEPEKEVARE